jgi:hypothetical protein
MRCGWVGVDPRAMSLMSKASMRKRRMRAVLMLQAFIDESYDESVLSMGGYIATCEQWESFYSEWEKVLLQHPKIEYFKYSDYLRKEGQFYRLDTASADSKMADLYQVIRENAAGYVSAAVSPLEYRAIFGGKAFPKPIRSPYYCCMMTIITKLPKLLEESGLRGPVEFIFDRQLMEEEHILKLWYFLDEIGAIDHNLIKSAPAFKDDKDVLPLQAADMLAGRMRLALRDNWDLTPPVPIPQKHVFKLLPGFHFVWRKSDLQRFHEFMVQSERTAIRGMYGMHPFISMNFKGESPN